MILDTNTTFMETEDVSASTGTALVGDVIDLGANAVFPSRGHTLYLVITVTTTFTSAGSATVAFQLASDAAAAIATDGSQTIHLTTDAFDYDDLVAGWSLAIPLPYGPTYERYLGVQVVTGGATTTAGNISAHLTYDPQANYAYPDAVN